MLKGLPIRGIFDPGEEDLDRFELMSFNPDAFDEFEEDEEDEEEDEEK